MLWDCVSHLDEETLQQIQALGGLKAIAISHPHFYDSCLDWAEAFSCQVRLPVHQFTNDKVTLLRFSQWQLWLSTADIARMVLVAAVCMLCYACAQS